MIIVFIILCNNHCLCQINYYSHANHVQGVCPNEVNYIIRSNNFNPIGLSFKGIPDNTEYRISCFDLQKAQTAYENSLAKINLSKEEFTLISEIDTTNLSIFSTKHRLFLLIYIDKGKKIIKADLNSNFDFSDEESIIFESGRDNKGINQTESRTFSFGYEYVINKKISKKIINFSIEPFNKYVVKHNTEDEKFYIYLSMIDYVKGSIEIGNKIYYYATKPSGGVGAISTFDRFVMHFSEHEFITPMKFKSNELINEDDSIKIGEKFYYPTFSTFGDTLILSSTNHDSLKNLSLFDELSKITPINSKKLSFSQLHTFDFTIIDFWGTWCSPCVKDIPKLQYIYDKYRNGNVNLISISVDSNEKKVKEFLQKHKIKNVTLFEDINKGHDWLYKKLRITVFPTYLILDNKGIAIFSTNSIENLSLEIAKLLNY